MASRVDLKKGKKIIKEEPDNSAVEQLYEQLAKPVQPTVEDHYHDLQDEFGDLKVLGQEKVETEKLTQYLVDDKDIEGKSFLDRGEKIVFSLISAMAEYPPFREFRLERFPKKWMHYALSENGGRGRMGALEILKGNVQIGAMKEQGLPGQPLNGRRL